MIANPSDRNRRPSALLMAWCPMLRIRRLQVRILPSAPDQRAGTGWYRPSGFHALSGRCRHPDRTARITRKTSVTRSRRRGGNVSARRRIAARCSWVRSGAVGRLAARLTNPSPPVVASPMHAIEAPVNRLIDPHCPEDVRDIFSAEVAAVEGATAESHRTALRQTKPLNSAIGLTPNHPR